MRFTQSKHYGGRGPCGGFLIFTVFLVLPCALARYIPPFDLFDLETSAAEPRPAIIEKHRGDRYEPQELLIPHALPLVYNLDDDGHISVASEKVEKMLAPVGRFSYNRSPIIDDVVAKSEDLDQQTNNSENLEKQPSDAKAEGSDHGKGHKEEDAQFEKGGGKAFNSAHHGEHGDKGQKKYDGHHHYEKGKKGHHTKDHHSKEFAENGGDKKHYHHEDGYSGEHRKGEKGQKGSKYAERGEHNKGHNTKGSHVIHKKDEFEKKTEFFDEDGDSSEFEKHGGYSHQDKYKKGGHSKKSHDNGGTHNEHHGKEGHSEKGGHFKEDKGEKHQDGHDTHHSHDDKHGHKESHGVGQKWSYAKGDGGGGGGGDGGGKGSHSHVVIAVEVSPEKAKVAGATHNKDSETKESKFDTVDVKNKPDPSTKDVKENTNEPSSKKLKNVKSKIDHEKDYIKYKVKHKYGVKDKPKKNIFTEKTITDENIEAPHLISLPAPFRVAKIDSSDFKELIDASKTPTTKENEQIVQLNDAVENNKDVKIESSDFKEIIDAINAPSAKENGQVKYQPNFTENKPFNENVNLNVDLVDNVKDKLKPLPANENPYIVQVPDNLAVSDNTHPDFKAKISSLESKSIKLINTSSVRPPKKKKLKKRKKVRSELLTKEHDCDKKDPLEVQESQHFVIVAADGGHL